MFPEAVAHVVRLDALFSIATLDVSLGALPTAAVELVHASGAVGSPVADPPESKITTLMTSAE